MIFTNNERYSKMTNDFIRFTVLYIFKLEKYCRKNFEVIFSDANSFPSYRYYANSDNL